MISFPKPDVEQFFRTYLISNFAVAEDESKLIFSSNLNGIFNLWAMDLPEQYPYQFAQVDQQCSGIKIDKHQRFVLAQFDDNGDENDQIYALPFTGGKPQPFLTGEKTDKFVLSDISKDGNRIYYMSSQENPTFLNAYCYNLETKERTLVHEGVEILTSLQAIAPNEDSFITTKMYSNTHQISFVHTAGEQYSLTPDPAVAHIANEVTYVNDKTVYFVTDYNSDFAYVAKYDLTAKQFTPVLELENESVSELKWHEASNTLWILTSMGVEDKLYAYPLDDGQLENIELPVSCIEQLTIAKSGNVYILGRGATIPFNIYKKEPKKEWLRLTSNRVLGVGEEELIAPEVVTYQTFDHLEIEALLFRAKENNANGYTIFWPHGGPQASERKMYRAVFQCFINRGYNIFAPNFRGSTGYGSSFTKLVEGDWGDGPRLDCVAAMDWLFAKGISSKDKLFIVGGSYGGYMTLLLAGRHADYFKAAIDIFGPSNLFTFIDSVPPHWKPIMKQWVGDPVEDKEKLEAFSPITYISSMTKPMLVIQGANDPRVVKQESDQIVEALRSNGVDVEYLVFEDEGHGFAKKENEILAYTRMLEFLERHQ